MDDMEKILAGIADLKSMIHDLKSEVNGLKNTVTQQYSDTIRARTRALELTDALKTEFRQELKFLKEHTSQICSDLNNLRGAVSRTGEPLCQEPGHRAEDLAAISRKLAKVAEILA